MMYLIKKILVYSKWHCKVLLMKVPGGPKIPIYFSKQYSLLDNYEPYLISLLLSNNIYINTMLYALEQCLIIVTAQYIQGIIYPKCYTIGQAAIQV